MPRDDDPEVHVRRRASRGRAGRLTFRWILANGNVPQETVEAVLFR